MPLFCLQPSVAPHCSQGQSRLSGPVNEDDLTRPLPVIWPHHSAILHIVVALVTLTYLGFPKRAQLDRLKALLMRVILGCGHSTPSHLFSLSLGHPFRALPHCLVTQVGAPRSRLIGSPRSPAKAAAKTLPSPQSSLLVLLRPCHEGHRAQDGLLPRSHAHYTRYPTSSTCLRSAVQPSLLLSVAWHPHHTPHPAHASGTFACMCLRVAVGTSLTPQHPDHARHCVAWTTYHIISSCCRAGTEALGEEGIGSGSCLAPLAEKARVPWRLRQQLLLPSPSRAHIQGHSRYP